MKEMQRKPVLQNLLNPSTRLVLCDTCMKSIPQTPEAMDGAADDWPCASCRAMMMPVIEHMKREEVKGRMQTRINDLRAARLPKT